MVWHAVSNCRHRVHHFVAGCRVATSLITLPLYCYCIANVLQLLKVAQLGLKPAPNGQDFSWAPFGPPPAITATLPPSANRTKYAELQKKLDAGRGGAPGVGEPTTAAAGGGGGSGSSKVARGEECQSPRATTTAAAGVPRAVALQSRQRSTRLYTCPAFIGMCVYVCVKCYLCTGPITALHFHRHKPVLLTASVDWSVRLFRRDRDVPQLKFSSTTDAVYDVQWYGVWPCLRSGRTRKGQTWASVGTALSAG